ncbi:MAG TPA: hypothetical protein VK426_04710 [Methanobacterium sp.]|nr:hypothetical protein [Methanobacterium sp.]
MDENDKRMNSIIDEYKMSMGGSFFNKAPDKDHDVELEILAIENALEKYLFDTDKLLSIYDELSDFNKRELFRKVVVAFIKNKFNEK